jgi:ribose 5-phosphate isomerase B
MSLLEPVRSASSSTPSALVLGAGLAAEIVRVWLATPFSGDERHRRRVRKIQGIEGEQ